MLTKDINLSTQKAIERITLTITEKIFDRDKDTHMDGCQNSLLD